MSKTDSNKWDAAFDIIKSILQWAVVTALAFVYWMAMQLLFSVFLLNIWKVTFEEILRYSIVLTVITSAVYLGVIIHRKRNH